MNKHINKQFLTKNISDIEIFFFDEEDKNLIVRLNLHKLILIRCEYFQIIFSENSYFRKNENFYELFINKKIYIRKENILNFFKILYSDDYDILKYMNFIDCISIYLITEFFCCEYLNKKIIKYLINKIPEYKNEDLNIINLISNNNFQNSLLSWRLIEDIQNSCDRNGCIITLNNDDEKINFIKNIFLFNIIFKIIIHENDENILLSITHEKLNCIYEIQLQIILLTKKIYFFELKALTSSNNSYKTIKSIDKKLLNNSFKNNEKIIFGIIFYVNISNIYQSVCNDFKQIN